MGRLASPLYRQRKHMQYFTPEWAWDMPDEEVDAVRESYWRHIASLSLSADPHQLANANLHDGLVLDFICADSLFLRLRGGDLQRGYSDIEIAYVNPSISREDLETLRTVVGRPDIELLYDEVDVEEQRLVHRMLLSSTAEVEVRCQDVRVSENPVCSRKAV